LLKRNILVEPISSYLAKWKASDLAGDAWRRHGLVSGFAAVRNPNTGEILRGRSIARRIDPRADENCVWRPRATNVQNVPEVQQQLFATSAKHFGTVNAI